jgi:hypothetical protein
VSTFASDQQLPVTYDQNVEIDVAADVICADHVRLSFFEPAGSTRPDWGGDFYATPDQADQIADALRRQANEVRRRQRPR